MAQVAIVLELTHIAPPRESYTLTATIGGQNFNLIIDTGSPDTWIARHGYRRLKEKSPEDSSDGSSDDTSDDEPMPEINPCHLGNLYNPDLPVDGKWTEFLETEFGFGYESWEKAKGSIGRVPVFSLGGYAFNNALLQVASALNWDGKSVESGVLGLAGPASKVINHGGIPMENHNPDIRGEYDSFITQLLAVPQRPKVFTLALGRHGARSAIAFWGRAAAIPAQYGIQANMNLTTSATVTLQGNLLTVGEWLIKPNLYIFATASQISGQVGNGDTLALVDCGDELIRLKERAATMFHRLWTPDLTSLEEDKDGRIIVPNNATPPSLEITINGVAFMVAPQDLKLTLGDGTCRSGVQSSRDNGPQVLGIPFLKNVIAEFDVENHQMVFHQRRY